MEALRHWTGGGPLGPLGPTMSVASYGGGDGDISGPFGCWRVSRLGAGLINETWRVEADGRALVLQRVNPVFAPEIHDNIRAVTARLRAAGIQTPELLETPGGRPYAVDDEGGVWRLMTFVDGRTFDTAQSLDQVRSAGRLVARVHEALDGLDHEFVGLRAGVHDTPRHLASLRSALEAHRDHRLYDAVAPLGASILAASEALEALPALPETICHGDLKFNNLRFSDDGVEAICLVDLDTFAPMSLAFELGDAFRSWCNPGGEVAEGVRFDVEVFEAGYCGYAEGRGRALTAEERRGIVLGVEWISLELAARFAADALAERYFGWDATRHATRGEHNLERAQGQLRLHELARATRGARERVVASSDGDASRA